MVDEHVTTDVQATQPLPRWVVWLFLLLIVAIAAAFRFYRFGQVPPGPHYDEASKIFDALDVLAGQHTPFSLRPYGREMLHVYLALPLILLLGPNYLALRLLAATAGILTPLAVYLFVQELLGERNRRLAQMTGLFAALLIVVSYWAQSVNRIGFRANYVPLFETLCFLFFWRALRTDRWWEYAFSGLFLGLALNTYINSRFVPGVLLLFVAGCALTRTGRALILRRWQGWLVLAGAALLLFAPLLIFFLTHPGTFMMLAGGLSLFSPELNQGDLWGLLARSVLGNLGLFGLTGDPNWVFNIPRRPAMDVIPTLLFWVGLLLCLLRWRKPRYAFLVLWWGVMLLPGILAPDPIPHFLRTFGALPVACIIASIAAIELISFLSGRIRSLRTAAPVAGAVCLLLVVGWTGYRTWRDYFGDWAHHDEVYYVYNGYMADLAELMNRDADPQAVYIVPINYDRRGAVFHEYTLELLHGDSVPFQYIIADATTVTHDLTEICQGKRRVHLVVWTHGDHIDADPREVLPFYLERYGQKVAESAFRGYRIATYELPSAAVEFAMLPDSAAFEAVFADELRLVAAAHETSVPSGETAVVALRWQALWSCSGQAQWETESGKSCPHDWKASLRLLDAQGHMVAQSDILLLSNEHRSSSQWEPGQEVTTYHRLPIVPGALPGTAELVLVLYDPDTLAPAPVLAEGGSGTQDGGRDLHLALDSLQIGRLLRPANVDPEVLLSGAWLAPDIELIGYGLDRESVAPGETMRLSLYWHAWADIASEYSVILQLTGERGKVVSEWVEGPAYPTDAWQTDDRWRDWHDLEVAPDVPGGDYALAVRLGSTEVTGYPGVELGRIQVQGRPVLFQAPTIEHPLVVEFGPGIRLLGYDLGPEELTAGETLSLTLYWQAVTESDVSYTVFTHLLDRESRIRGQKDSVPAAGSLPTTLWVPEEIIVDRYEIAVDADAPPGEYVVEIGMYQAGTSQRLAIQDDTGFALGDHLLLDTRITVTR